MKSVSQGGRGLIESTQEFHVLHIDGQTRSNASETVVKELPLTIILNDRELVTLLSSPEDLKYLAVGFLYSEGLIKGKDELERILIDAERGVARVEARGENNTEEVFRRLITSGCGRGASFYSAADIEGQEKIVSRFQVRTRDIFNLVTRFQHQSRLFRTTGGIHSAALCSVTEIIVFAEDIGRHNAIDKVFGRCLLEDIPLGERMMLTSGRISSEILLKAAKRKIPIIVSRSAPTDLAVKLADDLGITLVGFVRGKRMNVYSGAFRVET